MDIRELREEEIPEALKIGQNLLNEMSSFNDVSVDWNQIKYLMMELIKRDDALVIVAEKDGEMLGGFMGVKEQLWFSSEYQAIDLMLFVNPTKRGAMVGIRLIKAYMKWAEEQDVARTILLNTTGISPEVVEGIYRAAGFTKIGGIYQC